MSESILTKAGLFRGLRAQALAIFGFFFLSGFILGNWIPRIPDVKAMFGLSATELGFALFALALGTLAAFLVAPRFIARFGLALSSLVGLSLWALAFWLVAFVAPFGALVVLMLVAGFFIGVTEVAMNSAADREERMCGVRIMSRAHGFWSMGSLVGAMFGGLTASIGFGFVAHFSIVLPVVILAGGVALMVLKQRGNSDADPQPSDEQKAFALPARGIMLLCLFPVGIMLIEGAFIDWSALFVRDTLSGSIAQASLVYAVFSLSMMITRLSGDWIQDRFALLTVARVSCLLAVLGISLFAFSPSVSFALVAALLSGIGVAIIYPMAMTVAAARPGRAEDNVAAMSLFAFTAFMIAPPLLGLIIDTVGMRAALLCLVPLALVSFALSSQINGKTGGQMPTPTPQALHDT
ncbi:MAG: MFS transporter [Pseudomonadota bacterium]